MPSATLENQAHTSIVAHESPIIPAKAAADAPLLSPEELIAVQSRRYSAKKFDPTRSIPKEAWAALEKSLWLSASSNGFQPWKFIVIHNRERREALVAHSRGQRQVADASHLVVFLARTELTSQDIDRWVHRVGEVRHTSPEALETQRQRLTTAWVTSPRPSFNASESAKYQVYIALGNFLTSAALLGIDTCPMGGFDPEAYDRELGLIGSGYTSIVLSPAGYRSPEDASAQAPKVRYRQHEVIEYRA